MPRCAGHKPDGTQCSRLVSGPHQFCFAHDPSKAEARSRYAASGGRGKASKEVRTLKGELRELIADVKSGDVDRNDAAAMISGYRALHAYLELERRVQEQEQLEARLQALEDAQAKPSSAGNGGRVTWG
jgi:hypothetical protein